MSENKPPIAGRFQKGQSGNPSGRPKVAGEIRELAQQHGPAALDRLVHLMKSKSPRVAVAAAIAILDRAYGKPPQAVQLNGQLGITGRLVIKG